MDFITGLSDINRFNTLLVCVDKLGKLCWLIPYRAGENELSTPAIIKLLFDHVVHLLVYNVLCSMTETQGLQQLSGKNCRKS